LEKDCDQLDIIDASFHYARVLVEAFGFRAVHALVQLDRLQEQQRTAVPQTV